jgi:hypothetical protein
VIDSGDILQLPFLVNVEGPFMAVMRFERELEAPAAKVAVEDLQLGSSDESSDQVTGTITVATYKVPPKPDVAATKASTSGKVTSAPAKAISSVKIKSTTIKTKGVKNGTR